MVRISGLGFLVLEFLGDYEGFLLEKKQLTMVDFDFSFDFWIGWFNLVCNGRCVEGAR